MIVVLALLCGQAAADGLTLEPIPGPDGAAPFRSPGGRGPIYVASPPGDANAERVFVLTQDGYVYVIDHGVLQTTPFLDLHAQTSTYNENGLFAIAFAPDYSTSRRFYVNYSDMSSNSRHATYPNLDEHVVVAYRTSASDANRADTTTAREILRIPSTGCTSMTSPHYGGQLTFGPDGKLWISVGDGGDGCGDNNRAKSLTDLHGKILRITPTPDAVAAPYYAIPPDNPLVGTPGIHRDEIWAYGLRNPWRFSFDAAAPHDLVIGDVGESLEEELDRLPSTLAAGAAPPFLGWPCVEGSISFGDCSVTQPAVSPYFTRSHTGGPCTSIIGGHVLRDPSLGGDFDGRYLFSYFCAGASSIDSGRIYTAALDAPAATARDEGLVAKIAGAATGFGLGSFGLDGCGHPYAMNVTAGGLWRIEGDTPGACGEFIAPQTTLGPEAPSGVVKSSDAVFPYVSTVRGSTFSCTLDGAPTGCGALTARGAGGSASVSGLADGPHTFTVAATDEAGNAGPAAARTWTVDAAPPQTTITDGPPARTRLRTLTYTFSSNEAGSTFTCSLDHAPSTACSSPMTYSDVPDGTHTLLVTATDRGGAVDPTPAERIVVVDSAAPDTFMTSGPQARTNATRATVAFGATESGSTTCSLDGARAAPCSTPITFTRLRPGRHTFSVFATDLAGNVDESPASVEWTVEPLALPALRVRARADGRAVLALGPLAQDAQGTAILRRGARRLSAISGFRATGGRPLTVELRLTRLARRMVARHRRLVVRVTITFDVGASLTKTLVVLAPRARRDSAPT